MSKNLTIDDIVGKKRINVIDIECYPNFFMIGCGYIFNGNLPGALSIQGRMDFKNETLEEDECERIRKIIENPCISFNGLKYDLPLIIQALSGKSVSELYELSNKMINEKRRLRVRDILNEEQRRYMYNLPHLDLIGLPFGKASLKAYGSRIHSDVIWDLPFVCDEHLSRKQKRIIMSY